MTLTSITFAVDLEVELTQWKTGLEIFDLAIACRENPEIRFESSEQINASEKRLLTFKEYAPIMIDQLSTYCKNTPHDKVYFLAHNGFDHDYTIIFDNLERFGLADYFIEKFGDALFLDSLAFFKEYKKNHSGQFYYQNQQNQWQQVSLSLTSLCDFFIKYKYYAHTAMIDAQSLIKLMDYCPHGSSGRSFLFLNRHQDYSKSCKTFSEVYEIYSKRKNLEKIRHVPGYGAQYKQLEVALVGRSIPTECIHAVLDGGFNWFALVDLGKKPKETIDEELKKIIWSDTQRTKFVDFCLEIGGQKIETEKKAETENN